MRAIRFIPYILLTLLSLPVAAAELQSLDSIRRAAQLFIEAQLEEAPGESEVRVSALDSRLRLARCELPLRADLPSHATPLGKVTVAVRCDGARPWSLMVPVVVSRYAEVLVAARPLGRGHQLQPQDLRWSRADLSRLRGYYRDLQALQGLMLRRNVKAGTVLTAVMVKPALLIHRGERVTIAAQGSGIAIRMEGEAMQAGARGALIKVRNLSSRRVIEAEVVSAGTVRVRL